MLERGWGPTGRYSSRKRVLAPSLTVFQNHPLNVHWTKRADPILGFPMGAGIKSEGLALLPQEPVVCSSLKGCVHCWPPGGCWGITKEQLETIKGLEHTQRAGMLQFAEEKAQGRWVLKSLKEWTSCIRKLFTKSCNTTRLYNNTGYMMHNWFKRQKESISPASGLHISGFCCTKNLWRQMFISWFRTEVDKLMEDKSINRC